MADSPRIEDLRRRVQKDPASIAFAQLAEELRRAGSLEESIEACRAGLAIHPAYLSARVTLGRALVETNALDEARTELETVLKSAPENLAAIRGLAEVFHRQGQLPEALAQYRAALALAKNDPDLQQTVEELAKTVEPQKPAHVSQGLSFEQMSSEIFGSAPPPSPAAPETASTPVASIPSPVESVPTAVQTGPDALQAVPNALQAVPDALQTVPDGVQSVPDTVQSVPGAVHSVPSPLQSAPDTVQTASSPLESLPAAAVQSTVEHDRELRIIAELERWLDAIHVARTQPGA